MVDRSTFHTFASWDYLQAHIRAGLAVYYQAPLDYRPSLISASVFKNGKIRVRPPTNAADPFTADRGHLERFKYRQTHAQRRADRLVSQYLDSRHWDNNRFGVSSDDILSDPDRYDRCERAAENGADGSTHREVIQDMRDNFRAWLQERHRGRRSEYAYRVESAAMDHFDDLEAWHTRNGSIDQEIG